MSEERETWTNPGKGLVYILQFDANHKPTSKGVRPGHKITLTVEERQMNQDRAAAPDRDLFTNGSLVPLRLVESASDYAEIAANPNLLGESDMRELFKLKATTFKDRLDSIDNPILVARMIEIANEEDAKGEDAEFTVYMAHFKHLERRLKQLQGTSGVVEVTQSALAKPAPATSGVMQALSEF
jgi:hypothetical protein